MSGSGSDQPKRKPAAPPETRPRGGRTEVGCVPTLACQRLPGRRGRRLSEAGAAQWRRGKAHIIFSFNRKGEKWTCTQGPALLCPAPEQRDRSREVAMALQGWGAQPRSSSLGSGGRCAHPQETCERPQSLHPGRLAKVPPLQPGRADAKRWLLLPMLNRRKPAGDVNNLGNAMVPENG